MRKSHRFKGCEAEMKRKTGWSCPPGEDRQLRLDDLDPDDDEQQGADDQDDELEQSLQDGVGEAVFALQDLPQRVQQHGQRELRAATERAGQYHTARLYLTSDLGSDQSDHLRTFLPYPLCHKHLVDAADANHSDSLLLTQRCCGH